MSNSEESTAPQAQSRAIALKVHNRLFYRPGHASSRPPRDVADDPARMAAPDDTFQAVESGRWWDAIAIDGELGTRTCAELATRKDESGPVACAHHGATPRCYILTSPGTGKTWSEPETQVLSTGCSIGLPGSLTSTAHAVRWVIPPCPANRLTTAHQVKAALAAARRHIGGHL